MVVVGWCLLLCAELLIVGVCCCSLSCDYLGCCVLVGFVCCCWLVVVVVDVRYLLCVGCCLLFVAR